MADQQKNQLSRRDALKIIAAAGTVVLMAAPDKWAKPIVQLGALPAHAQTSVQLGLTCPADPNTVTIQGGNFSDTASVQVSPVTQNVSMTYNITVTNGLLNSPVSSTGTVLTNASGVATLPLDATPFGGNGSLTITWSFTSPAVGTGTCDTVFTWIAADF